MADSPAKQKAHAEKIKFERGLMDVTGMTRSQVRTALKLFGPRMEQAKVGARPVNFAPMQVAETRLDKQKTDQQTKQATAVPSPKETQNGRIAYLTVLVREEGELSPSLKEVEIRIIDTENQTRYAIEPVTTCSESGNVTRSYFRTLT